MSNHTYILFLRKVKLDHFTIIKQYHIQVYRFEETGKT